MNLDTLLLISALICFVLDALSDRLNLHVGDTRLASVGLALWVLSLLV